MAERRGLGCFPALIVAGAVGLSGWKVAQRFNDCGKGLFPGGSDFPTQTMYRGDGSPTKDFGEAQAVGTGFDERFGPATRQCREVRSVKDGLTIEHYAGVTLDLPSGEDVTLSCGEESRCHVFGVGLHVGVGPEGLQTPIGNLTWGNSEGFGWAPAE